ncbi:MAG: hypothetical protein A2033_04360 [Bacteroidetes bacterium GWA2_31_9]|nr:MAG: hypothetical protein A2033_04360 [Bacteroidetes bacterium GWA2_31_9]
METVFKLKASELKSNFIDSVKALFKNNEIEITVKQVQDETEYLLSTPANKKALNDAIKEVKKNKNLIRFTAKEFEEYSKKLVNE